MDDHRMALEEYEGGYLRPEMTSGYGYQGGSEALHSKAESE